MVEQCTVRDDEGEDGTDDTEESDESTPPPSASLFLRAAAESVKAVVVKSKLLEVSASSSSLLEFKVRLSRFSAAGIRPRDSSVLYTPGCANIYCMMSILGK